MSSAIVRVGGAGKTVKSIYIKVGGADKQVKKGYVLVGGQSKLFYQSAVTLTDLFPFSGPSVSQRSEYKGGEGNSHSTSRGWQLFGMQPGIGYANPGRIYKAISLVKGHVYYVSAIGSSYGSNALNYTIPGASGAASGTQPGLNVSKLWTSNATSLTVSFQPQANVNDDYCMVNNCDIVNLTTAFGAGDEPTLAWCAANLRSKNGTYTINL